MNIFTALLLAFGVAMDAFAVAVANGSATKKIYLTDALKMAVIFGLFQGVMPVIGWVVGINFIDLISAWDHWIAFILLGIIGGKMIYDDLKPGDDEGVDEHSISIYQLLLLALATSIDALAVGFSLIVLDSILLPVLTIGIVTFALSLGGFYLGHKYKHFGHNKTRIIGGIILIGIGTKILIEHLSAQ
ncbi:MAG: manganese efflux pump MntP family protein [Pyrinomonadaceae bacterium]